MTMVDPGKMVQVGVGEKGCRIDGVHENVECHEGGKRGHEEDDA